MRRYFVIVPIYFFGKRFEEAQKLEETSGVKPTLDDLDEVNYKVYLDAIIGEFIAPDFYGFKCLNISLGTGDLAIKLLPKEWEELKKKPQIEEYF